MIIIALESKSIVECQRFLLPTPIAAIGTIVKWRCGQKARAGWSPSFTYDLRLKFKKKKNLQIIKPRLEKLSRAQFNHPQLYELGFAKIVDTTNKVTF